MVCNVLTPFVSLVQSTLKVIPNFGSTTKGSVPPSCDGTTIVRTHEIVAMVPRCLCHPGKHFQVLVRQRESPQSQKTHQWTLNHWTRQHHRHLVFTSLFTPDQFGIMPKRLPWPHRDDEILSGHEEDVSSIKDGYTAWVMTDPELILERHLVSKSGAMTIYRDSHDRRHSSPNPEYRFINDVPNRLLEQTRLSILNWNPGTRRGKEGAIENHIAGKWHIIALQEASEHLEHDYLSSLFHVTDSPDALFFSTKAPSILTLRSAPFTSTIPEIGRRS